MIFEENTLVLADCLQFLERVDSNIADLFYLDPPWNTTSDFIYTNENINLAELKVSYDGFIFKVIQQAHRILKPSGNLFLYSIPLLNVNFHNIISPIFCLNNYRAEFIIPNKRLQLGNKNFTHNHETVIYYSKTDQSYFNSTRYLNETELNELFPFEDSKGRFGITDLIVSRSGNNKSFDWMGYQLPPGKVWKFEETVLNALLDKDKIFIESDMLLPKMKQYAAEKSTQGLSSVWDDIPAYNSNKASRVGSQSEEILKRIISISSKEGDLVIDPFVGSGTTIAVANKLNRKWYGIDISADAITICKNRLDHIDNLSSYNFFIEEDIQLKKIIWNEYVPLIESKSDVLRNKILRGENDRVEFKESLVWNHFQKSRDGTIIDKIIKEIAAFMNSKLGGSIIIGVKDDGSIIGLEKDYEEINNQKANSDGFNLYLCDSIKAKLGPNSFNLYHMDHFIVENKSVCEIEVEPSNKPIFFINEFYTRNGSQSIKLNTEEFYKFILESEKRIDTTTT